MRKKKGLPYKTQQTKRWVHTNTKKDDSIRHLKWQMKYLIFFKYERNLFLKADLAELIIIIIM